MASKTVLAASQIVIVVTAAAGVAIMSGNDDEANPLPQTLEETTPALSQLPAFNLSWDGHFKLGVADCAMVACPAHTYETEPFAEPLAKAGVRVEIPVNTSILEFELRWKGDERLHLMIHGPMKPDHSMPSYMGMAGATGTVCLAIAPGEIVAGVWELMAHAGSRGYQDTRFTIHVNGEGPTPANLGVGPHGHPIQEEWSMDMKQAQACRSTAP